MILVAQAGLLGSLVYILIIAIILAAIIYVAQLILPIPPKIVQIIWILFLVVVVIFALKFLVGLV